ncbi:biotin--[acetyl-CoA-carboxylase] ligase [Salinarimonas soli]|uniref:biotin--[biotin carboxyl-carrier protein] ligase n=1 Tax=Salinarimonas soli TaxID=1638099 RepID=A0A5B2VZ86_9HYPH|nr:biotin--[acetyl-CoA-carboxylase] ligase [Salinarimonas soli]
MAAARDGDPGRLWFVAGRQLAGRGRQGRVWASPPGNLYSSLLLVDPCALNEAPQLGFVIGLALHDAVTAAMANTSGAGSVTLKWPNDLLVGGAKIAGILLEGRTVGTPGALAVAIGCGVNVTDSPEGTPYPTTHLAAHAPRANRASLFEALSAAMAARLAEWDRGRNFAALRSGWLERAAGLGTEARVRLPGGERHGRFVGLDPHGRLQLETADGLELIDAGDLYFPNLTMQSDVRNDAV